MRALILGVIVIVGSSLASCIDASRVSTTCRFIDGVAGTLNLARVSDREHLRQDAQVAWEVGQRYADVRYRSQPNLARPILNACRGAMYDSIASRARLWWVDICFVFLPMLVVTAIAMDVTTREIERSVANAKARVAVLAMFVGLVALIATGVMQMWAMTLETLRLRNGHIAGRVFTLPSVAHPGIAFASLCIATLIVAAWRSSRVASNAIACEPERLRSYLPPADRART
jgi:hypothetical protein